MVNPLANSWTYILLALLLYGVLNQPQANDLFMILTPPNRLYPGQDNCVSFLSGVPPSNILVLTTDNMPLPRPCGDNTIVQIFQLIEASTGNYYIALPSNTNIQVSFEPGTNDLFLYDHTVPNGHFYRTFNFQRQESGKFGIFSSNDGERAFFDNDYGAGFMIQIKPISIGPQSSFEFDFLLAVPPLTLPTTPFRMKVAASPVGTNLCLGVLNIVCGELSTTQLQVCSTRTGYTRQEFKFVDKTTNCAVSGGCYSIGFAKKSDVALLLKTGPSLTTAEYSAQNADTRSKYDFIISMHSATVNSATTDVYKLKLVVTGASAGTYYLTRLGLSSIAEGDVVGWTTTDPTSGSPDLNGLWLFDSIS